MKKLIAVLVTVMMAFSCVSALAEGSALLDTSMIPSITVDSNIQVNEDAVVSLLAAQGMDEDSMSMVKMLLPLFNGLGEHAVFADNGLQYDLTLNGKDILSFVAEMKDSGIALATDLLPSYVLTLQYETVAKLMEQYFAQAEEAAKALDMEALMKAAENIANYAAELIPVYQAAITFGEPVKGEYADLIEGVVFNTEMPLSVDVNAIIAAAKSFTEKVIADESVKAALKSIESMIPGGNLNLSDLAMEDVPEEDIPEVSGLVYTITDDEGNQIAENTYVVVNAVGKKDNSGNCNTYVYVTANSADVLVEVPAQEVSIECYVETLEEGYTMNYAITAPGVDIELASAVTMNDAGIGMAAELYVNDIEQPLVTATMDVIMDGERTKTTADGAKAELALDGLTDEEKSAEVLGAVIMDMMNGMGTVIENIKAVEPEAGAVLEMLVTQVMTMFMGGAEAVPAA